jgi:hypothetical protein
MALPFGFLIMAIARHAFAIRHHRRAAAHNAIEQAGFAHVRPSGYYGAGQVHRV